MYCPLLLSLTKLQTRALSKGRAMRVPRGPGLPETNKWWAPNTVTTYRVGEEKGWN